LCTAINHGAQGANTADGKLHHRNLIVAVSEQLLKLSDLVASSEGTLEANEHISDGRDKLSDKQIRQFWVDLTQDLASHVIAAAAPRRNGTVEMDSSNGSPVLMIDLEDAYQADGSLLKGATLNKNIFSHLIAFHGRLSLHFPATTNKQNRNL